MKVIPNHRLAGRDPFGAESNDVTHLLAKPHRRGGAAVLRDSPGGLGVSHWVCAGSRQAEGAG